MGGAWKRLIRSVKRALKSSLPTRRPTPELLDTILAEVECLINSRPLTYIGEYDLSPLTPNHFLIGSSNTVKPIAPFTDDVMIQRKNWRIQ